MKWSAIPAVAHIAYVSSDWKAAKSKQEVLHGQLMKTTFITSDAQIDKSDIFCKNSRKHSIMSHKDHQRPQFTINKPEHPFLRPSVLCIIKVSYVLLTRLWFLYTLSRCLLSLASPATGKPEHTGNETSVSKLNRSTQKVVMDYLPSVACLLFTKVTVYVIIFAKKA